MKYNRLWTLLSMLTVLLWLIPTTVTAEQPDPALPVDVTVHCQHDDIPLSGMTVNLYQIADIDDDGRYLPAPGYENFSIVIDSSNPDAWQDSAIALEGSSLHANIMPAATVVTDDNGRAHFDELPHGIFLMTFAMHTQGDYRYRMDPLVLRLPTPQTDGTLDYHVEVSPKAGRSVKDDTPVTRKVLKRWEDTDLEDARPKDITVFLYGDRVLYDTVSLNADNNWRYTWVDLAPDVDWIITEEIVQPYLPIIQREGVTFVIRNIHIDIFEENYPDGDVPDTPPNTDEPSQPPDKEETPGDDTPKEDIPSTTPPTDNTTNGQTTATTITGGSSKLPQTGQLWWPIPLLIAVGLLFIAVGIIRRRGDRS